ncbi:hypothetical protein V8E54_000531 [Elaphomyces granulatus]
MTSHGFSFPPPPPPPPSSFSGPPQQHPSFTPSAIGHGHNSNGPRGGRGAGGYHRGRGRGDGYRPRRGGHLASQDVGPSSLYRQNNTTSVTSYTSFASPPLTSPATSAPPYQGSPFPPQQAQSTFPTGRPFAGPPTPHISSYSHRPTYDTAYGPSTKLSRPPQLPPPAGYASAVRPPPRSYPTVSHAPHTPPAVVTPPVHWGFEDPSARGFYSGGSRTSKPGAFARPNAAYNNTHLGGGSFANHGNKRTFSSAFEKPQSIAPRTAAPPPVPSFGNPLPAKPPPPVDTVRKPRKKKCLHNQLGLTPRGEEHESSEEEDDVDEEAKLADGLGAEPLQFTYKGRTSTLQSAAEIAAWVEERKKRYPTQARIEEKKKALEEAKKARNQQKEPQSVKHRRQQKETRAQKEREKLEHKGQQNHTSDAMDAAEKAKLKAEKLRRKLVREEKRVAKAEADAERARLKAEALQQDSHGSNAVRRPEFSPDTLQVVAVATSSDDGGHLDEHEEKSVPPLTDGHAVLEEPQEPSDRVPLHKTAIPRPAGTGELQLDVALSTPLSEPTDSSDETSSNGSDASSPLSSSSLSDTGDSDGDSPPEEASSHRDGPQRVAPPPREGKKSKKLCHHFARKGRCSRGDRCRFLHELPDGGSRTRPAEKKGHEKTTKKGLLQMLVTREKDDGDRRVMQAITLLGSQGVLNELSPSLADEHARNDDNNDGL